MRSARWAGLLLACAAAFAIGCTPTCPSDEVRVKKAEGGSVCVPTSRGPATAAEADGDVGPEDSPYGSVKLPDQTRDASPPSSSSPSPSPAAGCRAEDAGDLTVHLVAKGGAAPVLDASAAPDGRYVLAQATWFGGSFGAPTISALRAEVLVQGAVYVLGARAVSGTIVDANESVTLTIAADTATHVCAVDGGDVVSSLLPKVGATTRATVAWDVVASTLTVTLMTPKGADVELVFVPD